MPSCFSCRKDIGISDRDRIGRTESCPHCDNDLHCCRNCRFYDPSRHNECSEPVAMRVLDKDRANFCEFFKMADQPLDTQGKNVSEAKRKLEELFRKKGSEGL